MDAYSSFAYVYDTFMDETPYDQWRDYILDAFNENGISGGLVLDLGCGTGILTTLLAKEGYDMIGVDLSYDMLNVARENAEAMNLNDILFLCQDMREFELYGTVKAVVSVCDSINYLLDKDDIIKTFKLVNNYLDKNGIFIFDFNTVYKYKDIIGDTVIAENRDECSFIWENYFDDGNNLNEYQLTLFIKNGDDLFEKYEEEHIQRGYTFSEMKEMVTDAGLTFVKAFDTDRRCEPDELSQRITIIAKEKYQEGKLYIENEQNN